MAGMGISLVEAGSVSRQKFLYKAAAYQTNKVGHRTNIIGVVEDFLACSREEAVQIASVKLADDIKSVMDAGGTFEIIAYNIKPD